MVSGELCAKRLVFVDEMGSNTSLHELYAYSPRGERAYCSVASNRGKNMTLLASMGLAGMGPSRVVEGGSRRGGFRNLSARDAPARPREGDMVVMDNLSVNKSERVRELIEGEGVEVLYLPPYSPDFNPIEEAFSKIKNLCAKRGRASTKHSSRRLGRRSWRSARRMRRHSSSIAATVRRFNYYDGRCSYDDQCDRYQDNWKTTCFGQRGFGFHAILDS